MKAFANVNPRDLTEAVTLLARASQRGARAVPAAGGSDLLALVKERIVEPDVLVNLKSVPGLDGIAVTSAGARIGGLATLAAISRHPELVARYRVLAEAARSVGTPQIRQVATLAGNVCQRPWCWYFRNNFPCLKNGGRICYAASGENQYHAIFGGGPSYIVHPSDAAPALVALEATFRLVGPKGERRVRADDFFVLPRQDVRRENVLEPSELLVDVSLPPLEPTVASTYAKVMDREAWTHAVVSAAIVLDFDGAVCRRARIVLGGVAPIPWRVTEAERALEGRTLTPTVAAQAAEAAVAGARPLAKNAYKVPLARHLVRRALLSLGARA
jgi:xanthine dehydrogenase YagS FAD-binding subunit